MRLLRSRGRLATFGLGLVVAGLGVLGAGSTVRPAAAAGEVYEVASLLMSERGGPVYACHFILTSDPPQCGGGVLVNGADIQHIPGVTRYPNGTLESPVMHLTGRWAGRALTLTEPPRPATSWTKLPDPCTQEPGTSSAGGVPPRQQQLANEQAALEAQGISVMETITCGDTLGIGVAVADPATVRYLESHYGKVTVTGWLRPVSSGP